MNRKIFSALFISLLLFTSRINALELPDKIQEWHSVSEYVVPLIAAKDNKDFGRCVYRDYVREAPKGYMQVILTEGSGTGTLYVPERVNDSKGVMSSSSGYEILSVAGHDSIIEHHDNMPAVLAVNVSKDIILTIETTALSEEEIKLIAENILNIIINH